MRYSVPAAAREVVFGLSVFGLSNVSTFGIDVALVDPVRAGGQGCPVMRKGGLARLFLKQASVLENKKEGLAMEKNPSLDAELDVYSVTARPLPNRKPPTKRLGELALYTAAAGSAFALAPVAEASIIYSGIRDITLHRTTNAPSSAFVDLNGNGERDFAIFISSHLLPPTNWTSLLLKGLPLRLPVSTAQPGSLLTITAAC